MSTQSDAEAAADVFAAAFLNVLKDRLRLTQSVTTSTDGTVRIHISLVYQDPDKPAGGLEYITGVTAAFKVTQPAPQPLIITGAT